MDALLLPARRYLNSSDSAFVAGATERERTLPIGNDQVATASARPIQKADTWLLRHADQSIDPRFSEKRKAWVSPHRGALVPSLHVVAESGETDLPYVVTCMLVAFESGFIPCASDLNI